MATNFRLSFLVMYLYVHLAKIKVDCQFEEGEAELLRPCPFGEIHSKLRYTSILILKS